MILGYNNVTINIDAQKWTKSVTLSQKFDKFFEFGYLLIPLTMHATRILYWCKWIRLLQC